MSYTKSNFGQYEGNVVELFTLSNDNGIKVKITNYGATITSIKVPDKDGHIEEIACGFDSFEGYFSEAYQANAPYFGGTVGRYTSQIKDAKFTLHEVEYQLEKNVGNNNLHGGKVGFDKRMWEGKFIEAEGFTKLEMTLLSADMEEGFPGNVSVKVTFSLNNNNELKIDYQASSDQDTPFSITNHSYFNLSGFRSSIENHLVQIQADKRQEWDETGAATGTIISVEAAPDDLRTSKTIKSVQAEMGDGFEHYYVFDEKGFNLAEVAEIKCLESGRSMKVATSEPGMLFYTGKYTADNLQRESGENYGKYMGFCFETHRYPNGPNIDSPKSILKAGELFSSTTIFSFNW